MNRAEEKAQRLLQIEKLLWAHPEGLTRAEIARRLGVNRSTITKYLDTNQLPPGIYEDDLDGNKLKMDRNADLTKASFNLHEVMAIHLATRLLATRTDKQNPPRGLGAAQAGNRLTAAGQERQRTPAALGRRDGRGGGVSGSGVPGRAGEADTLRNRSQKGQMATRRPSTCLMMPSPSSASTRCRRGCWQASSIASTTTWPDATSGILFPCRATQATLQLLRLVGWLRPSY